MKLIVITPEFINKELDQIIKLSRLIPFDEWDLDNFLYELPKKWEASIALMDNQEIIGYIIGSKKENVLHIHKICVAEKWQGQDIGKKLIAKSGEIAKNIDANSLGVKVHESNKKAINFYIKLGFTRIDKKENYESYILKIDKS